MDVIAQLHQSLDARIVPEAVCNLIDQAIGEQLDAEQRRILHRAQSARWYWSMSDDFERPVPATRSAANIRAVAHAFSARARSRTTAAACSPVIVSGSSRAPKRSASVRR